MLHRIRIRKYNPEKPPEVNYEEAQWEIDDNMVVPQDDLYTLAWEAEFGGHLLDISILYTDPKAIDFDESYTQGPDTVFVPRSFFHDSSDCQKTGKVALLPTHLYCNPQTISCMVKIKLL